MALEKDTLRAHKNRGRKLGHADQLRGSLLKLFGKHVIRIITKTVVPQSDVGRVPAHFFAPAAQVFHPDIADSGCGKASLQRFTVKVRKAARNRKGTNIDERGNG